MADREDRSGRKRGRGVDDEGSIRVAKMAKSSEDKTVNRSSDRPVNRENLFTVESARKYSASLPIISQERPRRTGQWRLVEKRQLSAAQEEEEEESRERPTQTPVCSKGAKLPIPDERHNRSSEATTEGNEGLVSPGVDREVANSQVELSSRERRLHEFVGDQRINPNGEDGSTYREIEGNEAVKRQGGKLVPVSNKKTRTKTTTTITKTESNDTTTTTVTKTTKKYHGRDLREDE